MTIKEEFEKACEVQFGKRPKVISHNIDEIWDSAKYGAEWGAKWMAERCAEVSLDFEDQFQGKQIALRIRQLAKELNQ